MGEYIQCLDHWLARYASLIRHPHYGYVILSLVCKAVVTQYRACFGKQATRRNVVKEKYRVSEREADWRINSENILRAYGNVTYTKAQNGCGGDIILTSNHAVPTTATPAPGTFSHSGRCLVPPIGDRFFLQNAQPSLVIPNPHNTNTGLVHLHGLLTQGKASKRSDAPPFVHFQHPSSGEGFRLKDLLLGGTKDVKAHRPLSLMRNPTIIEYVCSYSTPSLYPLLYYSLPTDGINLTLPHDVVELLCFSLIPYLLPCSLWPLSPIIPPSIHFFQIRSDIRALHTFFLLAGCWDSPELDSKWKVELDVTLQPISSLVST